jgi:hypothetical protein
MPELRYVLDKMSESNFSMPTYVSYDKKTADAGNAGDIPVSYENNEFPTDSQENIWLSALKVAGSDTMNESVKKFYNDRIYAAADRYGIRPDLEKAAAFVQNLRDTPEPLRTESDWRKARNWLQKFASVLETPLRIALANTLLTKAAEVGYIPAWSEIYELRKLAGMNPATPEMQKYAEEQIHAMPSGNIYTTEQFAAIPYEEAAESVSDLTKSASLGMPVLHAASFAKAASKASREEAEIVELLLTKHGQKPLIRARDYPLEINDEMLAAL